MQLFELPTEILHILFFDYIFFESDYVNFICVCRVLYTIFSPEIRATYFLKKYNSKMVIVMCLLKHPHVLSPPILNFLFEKNDIKISRNFCIDKLGELLGERISKPKGLVNCIYSRGKQLYGESTYNGDTDSQTVESLLSNIEDNLTELEDFIARTNYIPISPSQIRYGYISINYRDERNLFQLTLKAPSIVKAMAEQGFRYPLDGTWTWIDCFVKIGFDDNLDEKLVAQSLGVMADFKIANISPSNIYDALTRTRHNNLVIPYFLRVLHCFDEKVDYNVYDTVKKFTQDVLLGQCDPNHRLPFLIFFPALKAIYDIWKDDELLDWAFDDSYSLLRINIDTFSIEGKKNALKQYNICEVIDIYKWCIKKQKYQNIAFDVLICVLAIRPLRPCVGSPNLLRTSLLKTIPDNQEINERHISLVNNSENLIFRRFFYEKFTM